MICVNAFLSLCELLALCTVYVPGVYEDKQDTACFWSAEIYDLCISK